MTPEEHDLEMRRQAALELTVDAALGLGYRLQAVCLACPHRPVVDLQRLQRQGLGGRRISSLSFKCTACERARRKKSIHPAGKDTYCRVLFVGEKPSLASESASPF